MSFICCYKRSGGAIVVGADEERSLMRTNKPPPAVDKSCSGCCKRHKKLVIAFVLWALVTYLLLPREPVWEVTTVTFRNLSLPALQTEHLTPANTTRCPPDDECGEKLDKGCSTCPPRMENDGCVCRSIEGTTSVADLFGGIADFVSHIPTHQMITLALDVTAVAHNPNFFGATTDPGEFYVFYSDTKGIEHLLGRAGVDPLTVPGGTSVLPFGRPGDASVAVDVKIHGISSLLGMEIVQELLATNYRMRVRISGFVYAHAGPLRVKAAVGCKLQADVSKYLKPEKMFGVMTGHLPPTEFSEKLCSYTYGL